MHFYTQKIETTHFIKKKLLWAQVSVPTCGLTLEILII